MLHDFVLVRTVIVEPDFSGLFSLRLPTVRNRLLKYTPTEATFLRSRGSRRKVYRIVQFQR
ncbi:hypothetical protein, partial [Burkholderia cepacia]|uniref:hypothetical protein n=1 Tax=Burkholderia cepacia TaxID=292 RepID=UPI001C616391